jgi:hypothetical protein
MGQLNKIFNNETVDLVHVSADSSRFRVFLKTYGWAGFEVLWKLEEVKRVKKSKAYYDELIVLEEPKPFYVWWKPSFWLKRLLPENPFRRKTDSEEIKIHQQKTEAIQNHSRKKMSLWLRKADLQRYILKKVRRVPKKSTVQETYELWVEKNSIADIATIRVLTKQTIYAHFVQLIQTKAVYWGFTWG